MRTGLNIQCDGCGEWVSDPGGLLFSPPDAEGRVRKLHVCEGCWAAVPSLLSRLHENVTAERILAEAFAHLSDNGQAQFFIDVAAIAAEWPPGNFDQWYAVGRHLATCSCSTDRARDLIRSIAAGVGE